MSELSNDAYAKLVEAEADALKRGWIASRKQNHLCWCDTCYAAFVRARLGMPSA